MTIKRVSMVGAAAACAALAFAQPLAARAQGPGGPPHMGRPGGMGGGFGRPGGMGGGRMRMMQSLGLTPQQQAKMQAMMRAMQQEQEAKMNAILTPAQRKKWAAMRAQMRQGGGPGGGH